LLKTEFNAVFEPLFPVYTKEERSLGREKPFRYDCLRRLLTQPAGKRHLSAEEVRCLC